MSTEAKRRVVIGLCVSSVCGALGGFSSAADAAAQPFATTGALSSATSAQPFGSFGAFSSAATAQADVKLAGTWSIVFASPPCVQGCGDTWTFTQTAANTYTIGNAENFSVTNVAISTSGSGASVGTCWTAPSRDNADCPGGDAPGADYFIVPMSFSYPTGGPNTVRGTVSEYSSDGTPVPGEQDLPYTGTQVSCAGGCTTQSRASATTVACASTGSATGTLDCTATVADTTGDGTLATPTGTVNFSASAGSFAAPICELSAVPGGAACSARYTKPPPKNAPPGVSVTASYPGDSTFSGSIGTTLLKCNVLADGCNSVSGTVTTLECTVTECEGHAPREPVTVIARSGEDSFSAITKPDGKYTIGHLHAGTWRITPQLDRSTMVSDPKSRDITFNEAGPDTRGGVDFSVCDNDPPPGANDGCLPEFDYTMPARYGDSELTKSYGDPDHFTVAFTIRDGNCDRKATYAWFANGNPLKVEPTADKCQFEAKFDALGTYRVRVDQSGSAGSNRQLSFVKKVAVKDFLIVAIGDSLASGEGSPPYKEQPLFIGCDRSLRAYDSQSALKLELSDPRSSVTFLQLACSGAGIVAPKNTTFSRSDNSTLDQLEQLKGLIGDRKIDALTISVGINDTNFGGLVAICLERFHCGDLDTVDHYAEKLQQLPSLYDKLHDQLAELFPTKRLDAKDIYFVGYPDPLYASPGELCPVMISNGYSPTGPLGGGFENIGGEDEVTWAQEHFMTPLTLAGQRAADRFGWNYINLNAPDSPFQSHGYCNPSRWFNTVEDYKARKVNFDGILHPTPAGQTAIAQLLTPRLLANLVPDATAGPPS